LRASLDYCWNHSTTMAFMSLFNLHLWPFSNLAFKDPKITISTHPCDIAFQCLYATMKENCCSMLMKDVITKTPIFMWPALEDDIAATIQPGLSSFTSVVSLLQENHKRL
jgi:hypothetical protein